MKERTSQRDEMPALFTVIDARYMSTDRSKVSDVDLYDSLTWVERSRCDPVIDAQDQDVEITSELVADQLNHMSASASCPRCAEGCIAFGLELAARPSQD
jgi:hypothetical protein